MNAVWTILFAPLAAALLIAFVARRSRVLSAALSIAAIGISLALSVQLFLAFGRGAALAPAPITWLNLPGFPGLQVELGAVVDRMSLLMLLVVTGVGTAIHIFSLGYMKAEAGQPRYFAGLSLFTFSMLGVVLATNFIQMFLFWELVGLSSYLLIGFWFERPAAAEAAKKALLTNRVGDFGFMLGILLIWSLAGSLDFATLAARWPSAGHTAAAMAAALLVFCGAIGKSAQFPLHVWLPDAMEGPTPVSALIHAATMVAAGVYMMCRLTWLLAPSPLAMDIVAWTGGVTAVLAALIAVTQNDLKRVLAYSTLSQLGYMMMAVGLGGPVQSMFHLTTHAFFKALLFLAAGSVIHALHHEQDIWKMGGLSRRMPLTFGAFCVGTVALAGVWPLSGFYSKDAILLLALHHSPALFAVGAFTAFLTAFYMGRALCVAFLGRPRDAHLHDRAHESPLVMTLPLLFLAVLSIIGGWGQRVPEFLKPDLGTEAHAAGLTLALLAIPAVGFLLAARLYLRATPSDAPLRQVLGPAYRVLERKFFIDEFYGALVTYVQGGLALVCDQFDRYVIQRLAVRGLASGAAGAGRAVRLLQNGQVNLYVFVFGVGAALILYVVLIR
jgi:NADH-quinone oxidoreductase subunit L